MRKIRLFMISTIALASCAIINQGCSTNSQPKNMVWYRQGTSTDETRRDLAACQNEALINGRAYSPIAAQTAGQAVLLGMLASSSETSRENRIVQTCMIANGYSLVNANSPLLTDSQTTQPTPQQSEADRKLFEETKAKAESGDAMAQINLGCYYSSGQGVPKDEAESTKWFLKAAEQNMAFAQYIMGISYDEGDGAPQDYVEAYKWYNLASAQGNMDAKKHLTIITSKMTPDQIAEGQRRAEEFAPQNENVSPETATKLLGHWMFIPSPEKTIRGQLDCYFLPQNRYKFNSSLININKQPLLPTPEEFGRYYFAGNKLVTLGDKDEKPGPPVAFSVTDTQLTFQVGGWHFIFNKQPQ